MGSEISSFIVEPLVGAGAVALAIYAILKQNKDEDKDAKWLAIASVATTVLLIILNIVLAIL